MDAATFGRNPFQNGDVGLIEARGQPPARACHHDRRARDDGGDRLEIGINRVAGCAHCRLRPAARRCKLRQARLVPSRYVWVARLARRVQMTVCQCLRERGPQRARVRQSGGTPAPPLGICFWHLPAFIGSLLNGRWAFSANITARPFASARSCDQTPPGNNFQILPRAEDFSPSSCGSGEIILFDQWNITAGETGIGRGHAVHKSHQTVFPASHHVRSTK